jgi:hypothetical protein
MRSCPLFVLFAALLVAQAPPPPPPPYALTTGEKAEIIAALTELGKRISLIRAGAHDASLLNDVEIYHQAAAWALRYPEEIYNNNYVDYLRLVLRRGIARARALENRQAPWTTRKGHVVRAYRSRVDTSLQPYAVVVPAAYNPQTPMRLDVILHGRNATLSEASFIASHEQPRSPDLHTDRLELHVFGRTNNAYRWAGETDVFEALEATCRNYRVDADRIVLRGFSMGGAGAWHIGLHHPTHWAAIEAGAGFNETIEYAKQTNIPPHLRPLLHIYDAVDYARNIFNLPTVGYGGELDPQLRASLNIQRQLQAEPDLNLAALPALFLIGPQTPHRFHPDSKRESEAFLDAHLPRRQPDEIQFVTYTTRYHRSGWVSIEALHRHYERAEVFARRSTTGVVVNTRNVAVLKLDGSPKRVTLDGQTVSSPDGVYSHTNGQWTAAPPSSGLRKRPGLQGPIDDAFMDTFLVVRPASLSDPRLNRFREEYAKFLRADLPETDDTAVTGDHIENHHLVLFGTPANNRLLAKIIPKLPVSWNRSTLVVAGKTYPAASHTLLMIYPNPLNPKRYVVLNSGHTFGAAEFKGTNALLYPRLGDWAVVDHTGKVVDTGLFNERWQFN